MLEFQQQYFILPVITTTTIAIYVYIQQLIGVLSAQIT